MWTDTIFASNILVAYMCVNEGGCDVHIPVTFGRWRNLKAAVILHMCVHAFYYYLLLLIVVVVALPGQAASREEPPPRLSRVAYCSTAQPLMMTGSDSR